MGERVPERSRMQGDARHHHERPSSVARRYFEGGVDRIRRRAQMGCVALQARRRNALHAFRRYAAQCRYRPASPLQPLGAGRGGSAHGSDL